MGNNKKELTIFDAMNQHTGCDFNKAMSGDSVEIEKMRKHFENETKRVKTKYERDSDECLWSDFHTKNNKDKETVDIIDNTEELNDEIVQYFVVNSELNMSIGKTAAQVAHVATNIANTLSQRENYCEVKREGRSEDPDYIAFDKECDLFEQWHDSNQPKIILRAKEKELLKLIDQGWYYIRDNGRTEIPENSLTVVGCVPDFKSKLKPIVKKFQLL